MPWEDQFGGSSLTTHHYNHPLKNLLSLLKEGFCSPPRFILEKVPIYWKSLMLTRMKRETYSYHEFSYLPISFYLLLDTYYWGHNESDMIIVKYLDDRKKSRDNSILYLETIDVSCPRKVFHCALSMALAELWIMFSLFQSVLPLGWMPGLKKGVWALPRSVSVMWISLPLWTVLSPPSSGWCLAFIQQIYIWTSTLSSVQTKKKSQLP